MQKTLAFRRPLGRATGRRAVMLGMAVAMTVSLMPHAKAQSGDAGKILKAMSDYVASQKTLSITFDSDIEVITENLQKIQFTNSGQVQLSRPDKLRATRTGGYRDVELLFDGKVVSVLNKDAKEFAQFDVSGTTDELVDTLRDKHGVPVPGADILLSNSFDAMMADVVDSAVIGKGVIDGVECDHLAFRNTDTDWQIWIEAGARPIPRKYVITNKAVAQGPQYTLRIKEWKTELPANAFAFNAEQSGKKVALDQIRDIDEVPQGAEKAGAKK